MSRSLAHTALLNLQCSNKHIRLRHHIGVPQQRLRNAKIKRGSPRGSFAVTDRRAVTCQSAEEVLELSEESVAEVLQV